MVGWKVFTYNPGHTESNLGPSNKVSMGAKSTADGARPMVSTLDMLPSAPFPDVVTGGDVEWRER